MVLIMYNLQLESAIFLNDNQLAKIEQKQLSHHTMLPSGLFHQLPLEGAVLWSFSSLNCSAQNEKEQSRSPFAKQLAPESWKLCNCGKTERSKEKDALQKQVWGKGKPEKVPNSKQVWSVGLENPQHDTAGWRELAPRLPQLPSSSQCRENLPLF